MAIAYRVYLSMYLNSILVVLTFDISVDVMQQLGAVSAKVLMIT